MLADKSAMEIKEGTLYALCSGFNDMDTRTRLLSSGEKEIDFSENSCDSTCLFSFVSVGERIDDGEVYKIYVLKSLANKKYLSGGEERYVSSLSKAFQFTARPAKEYENDAEIGTEWADYSHAVNFHSAGAEAAHTWIFCSAYSRYYIAFGKNPTFTSYCSSNNWFLLEAEEVEMTAYEKLEMVFYSYYEKPVDKNTYKVGTRPGCISQELYDLMEATYNEAVEVTMQPDLEDEAYIRMLNKIIATFDRYEKERIPLVSGYYFLRNEWCQHDIYEKDNGLYQTNFDSWSVDRAKSVWEVKMIEDGNGKFYLRNWATGNYFAKAPNTANQWTTTEDQEATFTAKLNNGNFYIIRDQNDRVVYNSMKEGDDRIINWSPDAEIRSSAHFEFIPVSADSMALVADAVKQSLLNKELNKFVSKVKNEITAVKNVAGLTYDGNYAAPGLVREFEKANANMNEPKNAFDGDVNTFYYTKWTSSAPKNDLHWVQVDLGKELQDIVIKFSWRADNNDFNPTRFALLTSDDLGAEKWTDTLYNENVVYEYSTPYADGSRDSTTYIGKIHMKKAAQHIRFAVTHTRKNTIVGGGPRWQISEIRFYDAAECVENPSYKLIPQEVVEECNAAIAAAEAELANNAGTQATLDRLQAAYDAFWAAYPDPTELKDAIEKAQELHDCASEEKAELGYYKAGAKADFQKNIDNVKNFVNSKEALNLDEIAKTEKQLAEAVKAFNAKIIVPEDGGVYRLISSAGFEYAEDGGDMKEAYSNDALICSNSADVNDAALWKYKSYECEERFNTLWSVEKNEEGAFAFKNLANGLYLKNPYEGLTEEEYGDAEHVLRFSETPNYFKLSASVNPGSFVFELNKNNFIHFGANNNVDRYNSRKSSYCAISMMKLEDEISLSYKVDVKPNTVQIVTLPIDLAAVYVGNNGTALQVSGIKDGYIHLVPFDDNNIIPAGTPFIVSTGEEDTYIETILANDGSIEENLDLNYVRTPIEMNGLVSAPQRVEIEAGYGYLMNGFVLISGDAQPIAAGSGYFNKSIPEATEESDITLKVAGEITSDGITSVGNVELTKNVNSDVYTISGVKVRSGVKFNSATKNLPKGIYIVGGKKVVVK